MTGNDCLPPSVRPEGSLKVVQFFSFPPLRSWVSCSAVQPFLWNATGRCTPSSLIPTSLTEAGQHFSPPDVSRHFPPLVDFIVREDFLLRRMKATESFLKKKLFYMHIIPLHSKLCLSGIIYCCVLISCQMNYFLKLLCYIAFYSKILCFFANKV